MARRTLLPLKTLSPSSPNRLLRSPSSVVERPEDEELPHFQSSKFHGCRCAAQVLLYSAEDERHENEMTGVVASRHLHQGCVSPPFPVPVPVSYSPQALGQLGRPQFGTQFP